MPTPPKRKPDSARRANRIIQQRTLLLLALLGIGTFLLLFAQLYKLQIKQHDELKTLAVRQQTLRTTVEASRGTIYDKNGDILALSSTAENVCVSPLDVAKNEQDQDLIANGLGEILGARHPAELQRQTHVFADFLLEHFQLLLGREEFAGDLVFKQCLARGLELADFRRAKLDTGVLLLVKLLAALVHALVLKARGVVVQEALHALLKPEKRGIAGDLGAQLAGFHHDG